MITPRISNSPNLVQRYGEELSELIQLSESAGLDTREELNAQSELISRVTLFLNNNPAPSCEDIDKVLIAIPPLVKCNQQKPIKRIIEILTGNNKEIAIYLVVKWQDFFNRVHPIDSNVKRDIFKPSVPTESLHVIIEESESDSD